MLIRVNWIGLVNIVGGRSICKEFIQHHATPEKIFEEADRLLSNPEAYQTMKNALKEVRDSLGKPGASQNAASIVLEECQR